MPEWERFDRKARAKVEEPLVTLQSSGTFSINEAGFNALGKPEQVDLLFDRRDNLVGFEPAQNGSATAYPIKQQANGKSFQTGGRAFCKRYGLKLGFARRFTARIMEGVLVVDLDSDGKPVGRSGQERKGEGE